MRDLETDSAYRHLPTLEYGASGLVSSVDDLYAFAEFLRRDVDGTIATALVEQATSDQRPATS